MRYPTLLMLLLGASSLLFFSACSTTPAAPDSPEPAVTVDPVVRSVDEIPHRIAPNDQTSIQWMVNGANAYVGRITLAPGAQVPPHQHDSEEYLYILAGGGVMTIGGQEYTLEPEMIVLVPTGVEHSYVNGPETTVAFQVFSSPEGADRFLQWPETTHPSR